MCQPNRIRIKGNGFQETHTREAGGGKIKGAREMINDTKNHSSFPVSFKAFF